MINFGVKCMPYQPNLTLSLSMVKPNTLVYFVTQLHTCPHAEPDKSISHFILHIIFTVSIHCAPEMSEIDCIGRIESFWPKFVRGW